MTNYTAIFPLEIVVFPNEWLNLHIFEPRYIHLIRECIDQQKSFVIAVMLNKELQETGTLVEIAEVKKTYENGTMDIRVKGIRPVRLLEVIRSDIPTLPHHAIVFHPENDTDNANPALLRFLYETMLDLHRSLRLRKKFKPASEITLSYDIAHHIGMSMNDEYHLLTIMKENQRLEMLRQHLTNILKIMKNLETLRERVNMNGHFRNLSAFDFE